MKEFILNITAEHIKNGEVTKYNKCAAALALGQMFPDKEIVVGYGLKAGKTIQVYIGENLYLGDASFNQAEAARIQMVLQKY